MPSQSDWRNCQKCQGLFFNGFPIKGVCPAKGQHQQHDPSTAFNFDLPRDVPGTDHAQPDWRNCHKCQGLFFNGFPIKGVCPAGGQHQQHDPSKAFNFVLPHDVPGTNPTNPSQSNWRNCHKCQGLFFNGFATKGVCPAGGQHEQHKPGTPFDFVLAHGIVPAKKVLPEKPNNPELGDPTGKGKKPDPPKDPPPEEGPTKKLDNTEVDGTLPDPPPPPPEGGCFIGDTPVLMADGLTKRIDAIAIGDQVMARDEKTGLVAVGAVDRVFRHHVAETLLLQMDGGEVVETTAQHRFAAEERGFVSAGQLRPGDRLSTHDERGAGVVSTGARSAEVTVYNLSVDRFHTFFVAGAGLWVHNLKKSDPPEEPGN